VPPGEHRAHALAGSEVEDETRREAELVAAAAVGAGSAIDASRDAVDGDRPADSFVTHQLVVRADLIKH
jgi:hypothetical protein